MRRILFVLLLVGCSSPPNNLPAPMEAEETHETEVAAQTFKVTLLSETGTTVGTWRGVTNVHSETVTDRWVVITLPDNHFVTVVGGILLIEEE